MGLKHHCFTWSRRRIPASLLLLLSAWEYEIYIWEETIFQPRKSPPLKMNWCCWGVSSLLFIQQLCQHHLISRNSVQCNFNPTECKFLNAKYLCGPASSSSSSSKSALKWLFAAPSVAVNVYVSPSTWQVGGKRQSASSTWSSCFQGRVELVNHSEF